MLRTLSFIVLIFIGTAFAQPAHATMTEQQKIDALLNNLGTSDVTFIRNGTEMTGKDAKAHLQDKLKELQSQVKTADDFITKVASTSRKTGKPYVIKLKDGKEIPAADWFKQQLGKFN